MHTCGLGGDSEVGLDRERRLTVGPRKAHAAQPARASRFPRCWRTCAVLAAEDYPPPLCRRSLRTAIPVAIPGTRLDRLERRVWDALAEPRARSDRSPAPAQGFEALRRLVDRGLATLAGFTPSDAMHVLGRQARLERGGRPHWAPRSWPPRSATPRAARTRDTAEHCASAPMSTCCARRHASSSKARSRRIRVSSRAMAAGGRWARCWRTRSPGARFSTLARCASAPGDAAGRDRCPGGGLLPGSGSPPGCAAARARARGRVQRRRRRRRGGLRDLRGAS